MRFSSADVGEVGDVLQRQRSPVSRLAIISGRAAFLAPEIGMVPIEAVSAGNANAIHQPESLSFRDSGPGHSPDRSRCCAFRRRRLLRSASARRRSRLSLSAFAVFEESCIRARSRRPARRLKGEGRTFLLFSPPVTRKAQPVF